MLNLDVDVTWRHFDKNPLSKRELEELIGDRDLKPFMNPRSGPYREHDLKNRAAIEKGELIDLILNDQNLLKRPLVVQGDTYIFGIDEEAYAQL